MYLLRGLGSDYQGFFIGINMRFVEPTMFELHILKMMEKLLNLEQSMCDEQHLFHANLFKFTAILIYNKSKPTFGRHNKPWFLYDLLQSSSSQFDSPKGGNGHFKKNKKSKKSNGKPQC